MASTLSSAGVVVEIAPAGTSNYVTVSGPESGLTGFPLVQTSSTNDVASGGLTVGTDGGYRVNSSSFSVNENETTAPVLCGQNGRRAAMRVTQSASGTVRTFNAILTISRVGNARGNIVYNVTVAIDGAIS